MNMKKIVAFALCLVLVAGLSIAGTVAYLTSESDEVKNTFTVGTVNITLDEAPVDLYGKTVGGDRRTENQYKLIPGHVYTKDPTVHVTAGSEESWLFVKVVNGLSEIEATGDTTIAAQIEANGWDLIDEANGIYAYEKSVDARTAAVDVKVFESFKLADNANISGYVTETNEDAVITIVAYAVQKDSFESASAAWNATYGVPNE